MISRIAGILLIVAGVISFVVFLVSSLFGVFDGLTRVDVPGARELKLAPGDYTIYWEIPSSFRKPGGPPDGLVIGVIGPDSQPLPLSSSGLMATRYSTGSRAGVSISTFRAATEGAHTVSTRVMEGKTLPEGTVVVGTSVGFFGVLKIVLGCLARLGTGLGVGIPLLVRSLKRSA